MKRYETLEVLLIELKEEDFVRCSPEEDEAQEDPFQA